MLAIIGRLARETHEVLGIFGGVGHQIADNLGYCLAVYHRSKIIGRIIYFQLSSILLQGWLETLCHGVHHLGDVLQAEMYLHSLLLYLVEIKQLIH